MTATEAANLTELMRDVVVEGTGSSVCAPMPIQ